MTLKAESAIAQIVAASNTAISQLLPIPGIEFLTQAKQVQAAALGSTANDVAAVVAGTLLPDEAVTNNTGAALDSLITGMAAGDIFPAALQINDVALTEPETGQRDFVFTVTLSAAMQVPVSVDYETLDSTASSIQGDFVASTGTISFAPGETEQTIVIPVLANNLNELGEKFQVALSNPTHAILPGRSR